MAPTAFQNGSTIINEYLWQYSINLGSNSANKAVFSDNGVLQPLMKIRINWSINFMDIIYRRKNLISQIEKTFTSEVDINHMAFFIGNIQLSNLDQLMNASRPFFTRLETQNRTMNDQFWGHLQRILSYSDCYRVKRRWQQCEHEIQ